VDANGLEFVQLTKSYPGFQLGPLSSVWPRGRSYGLIGPNGAGKTTLLNLICQQARSAGGEVRYRGDLVRWGDESWKNRISYVRETPAFYGELTVAATLRLASRLYRTWDQEFAASLLARLDLPAGKRVGHLSKGNAVKLGIVTAFAHRAELLVLDEPTSGLDPTARAEIHEILRTLQRESPELTLIFSSHILEDLDQVADELQILRNGAFVFRGAMRELGTLAVFKAPDTTMLPLLPDVRLRWRKDGHLFCTVPQGTPSADALGREPGWAQDSVGLTLATLYERTAHAC
jgi:ABC-2 type transport system ATP-binding protein